YAWIRYADVLLAKAEALNETGNTAGAAALVNQIRTRAKLGNLSAAQTASQSAMRAAIFEERGYEFIMEAVRRLDMIRAGTYTSADWQFKEKKEAFRVLYPIPQGAIDANSKLTQNAGY
ncbi:MAG TPA: RagB/SusD family nutrient uptake outer membrane protein, partial [Rhodothermales bacterium]|nr:RagB/SusD family nutrient uptake outer membrane protein [Rhodothermales bacterium]